MKLFNSICKIWGFIISFCFYQPQNIFGQEIRAMAIGDEIPNISFKNVVNSNKKKFSLSDFKGKLIILDFYGTWCGGCQEGILKLDNLQKQYKDQIKVVVLCHDKDNDIVEKTIKNRWKSKGIDINLPFVVVKDKDTLNQFFPHKMVPHEVWISKTGKLFATTDADEISDRNIKAMINGGNPSLNMKVDQMTFNYKNPLFSEIDSFGHKKLLYRFSIGKYIEGVSSINGRVMNYSNEIRRFFINATIIDLYLSAVGYSQYANRIFIDVKDSSKLLKRDIKWSDWLPNTSYCYEQYFTADITDSMAGKLMLNDLNNILPYTALLELKTVKCWELITINPSLEKIPPSKGGKSYSTLDIHHEPIKRIHNRPLSSLTDALMNNQEDRALNPIIFDKTGINYPVDLEIELIDLSDLSLVNEQLFHYNLTLKPTYKTLELLVIKDK